jgi:hypothetical protein
VDELATQDLDGLSEVVRAERVLALRRLLDRLEGHWRKELAAVDARGAAGAELDQQPGSTAAWLRHRLHLGAGAARSSVRTARALFAGPLAGTAQALTDGAISRPMLGSWPTAPVTCLIRLPPTLNQSCSRSPGASTHPGCAGRSGISAKSLIPTAPTRRPSAAMGAGACG